MSRLTIRQARRSEAKPLIGIYSESGCGKTYSALLLARGFVGVNGRIGMIETESGRGEAYADTLPGGFDVISLRDDFSPSSYGEAIDLAERSNLGALIIDSASHEWEGVGGVLHMAAEKQASGAKGPLVWQKAKIDHQRYFIGRLLQTPIPLVIVCMRAKYHMEEIIKDGRKEWARSTKLEPKQSEDILYEMFVHGWIDRDRHAFHATKYTRDDLANVIRDGQQISIETGASLARWSAGDKSNETHSNALALVLMAIEASFDMEQLEKVVPSANRLSDEDKKIAKAAYAKRGGVIRASKDVVDNFTTERQPGEEG